MLGNSFNYVVCEPEDRFEKINLGGMSNFIIDSKRYTGLNQFKLNFGSKMYEYAGDFEIITNKITAKKIEKYKR